MIRPRPVALRYDDFSEHSPKDVESAFFEALRSRGLNCAVAVVPFACGDHRDPEAPPGNPLSDETAARLRRAVQDGTVEPVLHGHSHRRLHPPSRLHRPSEFAGLSAERQTELLTEGKDLLEERTGARVRFFAPPWNSYDRSTLRALDDLGFDGLLAGRRFGPTLHGSNLQLIPATCELKDVTSALDQAMSLAKPPHVVAIFHPYDFVEVDADRGWMSIDDFGALLDELGTRSDVELVAWTDPAIETGDFGRHRFHLHGLLRHFWPLTPPWLQTLYRRLPPFYLPLSTARWWYLRNMAILEAYFGIVGMATAAAGLGLAAVLGGLATKTAAILAVLTCVALFVVLARRSSWNHLHATAFVASLGSVAGLMAGMLAFHAG